MKIMGDYKCKMLYTNEDFVGQFPLQAAPAPVNTQAPWQAQTTQAPWQAQTTQAPWQAQTTQAPWQAPTTQAPSQSGGSGNYFLKYISYNFYYKHFLHQLI